MTSLEPDTELARRVTTRLHQCWPHADIGKLLALPGGHSGLTYRIRCDNRWVVVKAVPPGQRSIGRHDVLRQARILDSLAATEVPVPRVLLVDRIEPAWFAMEFVKGESIEPVLDDPPLDPDVAAGRMRRLAEVLPVLHAVPLGILPAGQEPLSPAQELERWTRTMSSAPAEVVPHADDLERKLAAAVPAQLEPTLVHGDYRLGNVICAGTEPLALIDWEIWSLGDPRGELGWFLVFTDGSNFPGAGREVHGLPSEEELIALYAAQTRPVEAMAWFNALGRFKMAAIMAHNLRRHREGRHRDPDQEKLPATIAALITSGLDRLA